MLSELNILNGSPADDNLFAAIPYLLQTQDVTESDVDFLRSVANPMCSECNKKYLRNNFISFERQYFYRRCNKCADRNDEQRSSYLMELFVNLVIPV